ncbi:hypothetical protein QQP08_000397 [Theobroma cacao]|nr:hypothetical protein QQP08_000397 [Theobroma cacao]
MVKVGNVFILIFVEGWRRLQGWGSVGVQGGHLHPLKLLSLFQILLFSLHSINARSLSFTTATISHATLSALSWISLASD